MRDIHAANIRRGQKYISLIYEINRTGSKVQRKKTIMETSLYTIYLISAKKQTTANDEVLLLEHLPAKEPAAHLLPIKIKESATTTETMQKIVEAVHAHCAQNE